MIERAQGPFEIAGAMSPTVNWSSEFLERKLNRIFAKEWTSVGVRIRRHFPKTFCPMMLADRQGNPIATLEGDSLSPSVILFATMDWLGFVIGEVDPDGMIGLETIGGVPVRALPSQAVLPPPVMGMIFRVSSPIRLIAQLRRAKNTKS